MTSQEIKCLSRKYQQCKLGFFISTKEESHNIELFTLCDFSCVGMTKLRTKKTVYFRKPSIFYHLFSILFLRIHYRFNFLHFNRNITHQIKRSAFFLNYHIVFNANSETFSRNVNSGLNSKYHIRLHGFVK